MEKEYMMLRDEILHLDTVINNTINFFYIFIASYIAFALIQTDTIFILLTYVVIIPAYLIVLNSMKGMNKIGAYLAVFIEGDEFHWESRHMLFVDKYQKGHRILLSPFFMVNIAIIILFLSRTDIHSPMPVYEICKSISIVILFIYVSVLTYRNRNIRTVDYVEKWMDIKSSLK